jgi:hypothetical protein
MEVIMLNLFFAGGTLFMSLISLAAIAAFVLTANILLNGFSGNRTSRFSPNTIIIAGSLAFMLGILAQTIGIYQALVAIQQAGDVSPAMIFGGFKVSMIAPMYGLIILVITLIIRLALPFFTPQQEDWSDQTNS